MWEYLKKVTIKRFQLELDISDYFMGNKSIQEYYYGIVSLWIQFVKLVYPAVQDDGVPALQMFHQISQRNRFLMKLQKKNLNWFNPI